MTWIDMGTGEVHFTLMRAPHTYKQVSVSNLDEMMELIYESALYMENNGESFDFIVWSLQLLMEKYDEAMMSRRGYLRGSDGR